LDTILRVQIITREFNPVLDHSDHSNTAAILLRDWNGKREMNNEWGQNDG